MFDDKTATSDQMKYSDGRRSEWLKTTTNYLVSKVFEMRELLPWAESFQHKTITDEHIRALASSSLCLDVSPEKISRDLWGFLNLCLHGEQKVAFNNVAAGNGLDAWRRVVAPIGPRSDAQLHRMYKAVHNPMPAKRLADVLTELEAWEAKLHEFYRCGGGQFSDATKCIIAFGVLPMNTDHSIRLTLKPIKDYAAFKDAIRDNVSFLDDIGPRQAGAHVVDDSEDESDFRPPPAAGETERRRDAGFRQAAESRDPLNDNQERDIAAMVIRMHDDGYPPDMVAAAIKEKTNRFRFQNRGGQRERGRKFASEGPGGRARTPPRDPKDVKCANCNRAGCAKDRCPHPKLSMEQRKCHICGKAGHTARMCPDKEKRVVAFTGPPAAAGSQRQAHLGVIMDEDGYQQVGPRGIRFDEIPIRVRGASQREQRANRFAAFAETDDETTSTTTTTTTDSPTGLARQDEDRSDGGGTPR